MHEILQTSHEILHIVGLFPNEVVCRPFEENQTGLTQLNCEISVPLHIRPQTINFHLKSLQCFLHSVKYMFYLK